MDGQKADFDEYIVPVMNGHVCFSSLTNTSYLFK